jgi:uncharacterized protein YbjT (DUF2867 family)
MTFTEITSETRKPAPRTQPSRLHVTQPKKVAVFGATGGIGRHLVDLALESGFEVVALVRDASRLDENPRLQVHVGDMFDEDVVRRTVRGADAVFCALGAPAFSRSEVRSEGTKNIVHAMQEEGVRRLVCVSVLGAHESREGLPFFLRYVFFPFYLRRPVAEHELQERIIEESDLDWTIVRPPFLTDDAVTGSYAHGFGNDEPGLTLKISRADVADFMLRQLGSDDYLHQAAGISYRA